MALSLTVPPSQSLIVSLTHSLSPHSFSLSLALFSLKHLLSDSLNSHTRYLSLSHALSLSLVASFPHGLPLLSLTRSLSVPPSLVLPLTCSLTPLILLFSHSKFRTYWRASEPGRGEAAANPQRIGNTKKHLKSFRLAGL